MWIEFDEDDDACSQRDSHEPTDDTALGAPGLASAGHDDVWPCRLRRYHVNELGREQDSEFQDSTLLGRCHKLVRSFASPIL